MPQTVLPEISAVLPVWNEAENLPALHKRLKGVLDGLGRPYEILYVEDGSTDNTRDVLRSLQAADSHVRVILLRRNFGQHAAVLAGFSKVRGEIVVTLDADLQNPPEELPVLIAEVEKGCDIAAGYREIRYDSQLRKIPSFFFNHLAATVTKTKLRDFGCNLRAYRRVATDAIVSAANSSAHISVLPAWMGFEIKEVPVEHHPRTGGTSKYGFFTLARSLNNVITEFTVLPIQVLWVIGALMIAISVFSGLGLLVASWLRGAPVPLFGGLLSLAFFLGGLQLAGIGILGEYVSRILVLAKGKPIFIIKEVLETPPDGNERA